MKTTGLDYKKLASYLDKEEKVYCYEDDERMFLSEGAFIFAMPYSHELAKYRPLEKNTRYLYELGEMHKDCGYDIMKLWNGDNVTECQITVTNFLYECTNYGKPSDLYRKFTGSTEVVTEEETIEKEVTLWLNKKVLEIFTKDYTDFQSGSDLVALKVKGQKMLVKIVGCGIEALMMAANSNVVGI